MRTRPQDPNGDYTIGQDHLANSPACVAQSVLTRLKLLQGEWFMDLVDGTPYQQRILGKQTNGPGPDVWIRQRILGTEGVVSIVKYSSSYDGRTRTIFVSATVNTLYGQATISTQQVL